MGRIRTFVQRGLALGFMVAAGAGLALAQPALPASPPYVQARLVQVDVFDRAEGGALPVHAKDGRLYVVGTPGHEYVVRIRNTTGGRVLVVTSVDGVNVVTGDTASPAQSGYVLEPWGAVEITGWRKSMERVAAFYFTDLGDSYAARTGRPQNVGVIGVAVFQERTRTTWRDYERRARVAQAESGAADVGAKRQDADAPAAPAAAAPEPPAREQASDALARNEAQAPKTLGKLGTGHGRSEDSRVTMTNFERATSAPAETVAIQYDRRENLVALGVLPQPVPYLARRAPDPFPGAPRFAPDPR